MNNEPMNAPARPDVAGELRESGLEKILVLNVLSIRPLAFSSSAICRTSGLNCCCSSDKLRSILPFNQTSTFASAKTLTSLLAPNKLGFSIYISRKRYASELV